MGIASGWQKKTVEMSENATQLWKLANNTLRGLSRSEINDGQKIVGSRIWAAYNAQGLASGLLTEERIAELLAILTA